MTKRRVWVPGTSEWPGGALETILREFNGACPPCGISSFDNARRFHQYLLARWRTQPAPLPYLPDVAAYEVACAAFRRDERRAPMVPADDALPGNIRRHP